MKYFAETVYLYSLFKMCVFLDPLLQVKEKKTHIRTPKPPFMDFSPFKSSTVRMLIICSSIASFGSYAPLFFMSQHVPKERGVQEGNPQDPPLKDLVLLQTFLGLSIAFGIVASGSTINKNFTISYRKINISRQYVCQVSTIQERSAIFT